MRETGTVFGSPLVTWVDLAAELASIDPAEERWVRRPRGLVRISVDWTGIDIDHDPSTSSSEDILLWLESSISNMRLSATRREVLLDGPTGLDKLDLRFSTGDAEYLTTIGLGSVEGDIVFRIGPKAAAFSRPTKVVACHSAKGGTGRTTSAIAVALLWAKRTGKKILVVDADLEAPGLSYIFQSHRSEVAISLEDAIALTHASPASDVRAVAAWIGERLVDQAAGPLVVLPLRRRLGELASSAIRAENISTPEQPFALADLLSWIANSAGCDGVVVDVRAGLVPIAAQLLLDPNVPRVFCTSLADQSLRATADLIAYLSREMRKRQDRPLSTLLIANRIPSAFRDYGTDDKVLEPFLEQIENELSAGDDKEISNDQTLLDGLPGTSLYLAKVGEISDLLVPQRRWDDFIDQLSSSGFYSRLEVQCEDWFEEFLPHRTDVPSSELPTPPRVSSAERRLALQSFAQQVEFAESKAGNVDTPLVTAPLRALASQTTQPPIIVIEGAKGTGKTLTARYLLDKGNWSAAINDISGAQAAFDAVFLPALGSVQSSEPYQTQIDAQRGRVWAVLGGAQGQNVAETKSRIEAKLRSQADVSEWTDFWLDAMAWSAGISPSVAGAGVHLLERLRTTGQRVIATVEGIEELYTSTQDPGLPSMLRALLIDLPLKLRTEPGRPLGLIIFARRDTVDIGVHQNRAQFRNQYAEYALSWSERDVLELAAWLATKSDALNIWNEQFRTLSLSEMERQLETLWGRKLGRDEVPGGKRVQEAFTAGWVIAVLSDLQDRLAARDLVRFIREAAATSIVSADELAFGTRLLVPAALRSAVGPTSRQKVADTLDEIRELKEVFAKFTANEGTARAPLQPEDLHTLNLTDKDMDLLRIHGIILGDSAPYEVAELFRIGLGLKHRGARYSVVGMRRRAKQRAILF